MNIGASSVYTLIRKELMALKLEASTLGQAMKQVAHQSALEEVVRRHAETEAKLAMVADSLLALQARLDGIVIAQQQAAAAHLMLLQVRAEIRRLYDAEFSMIMQPLLDRSKGTHESWASPLRAAYRSTNYLIICGQL